MGQVGSNKKPFSKIVNKQAKWRDWAKVKFVKKNFMIRCDLVITWSHKDFRGLSFRVKGKHLPNPNNI